MIDRFPTELDDLLNARGRRLLASAPRFEELAARRETPIVFLEGVIDRDVARDCVRLLDEALHPLMRRMDVPIPRESVTEMETNYTETLGKTMRVRTATFNSRRSKVLDAAREIGLAQMMTSASFHGAAQAVTRSPLSASIGGRQVICYHAGDYSGAHNDHHPEDEGTCNGFVDLHLMFSNDAVAQQLLVYENRRYFSSSHEVSGKPSIAIYKLPFWHYTTPLVARRGQESRARRWLLLGSFDYDPPLAKLRY
jgi:hypothetical protein